jgi:predicted nucleic acid-binding protein
MVVVDASVAIKWFILEPEREAARRLLASRDRLLAPELVVAEVANALWKRGVSGEADVQQAPATAAALPRFFGRLFALAPLAGRALAIANDLGHPVYDCFYLALAERENAQLVTADRRLIARLAGSPWAATCRPLTS